MPSSAPNAVDATRGAVQGSHGGAAQRHTGQRIDALRNRERILVAARDLYAVRGLGVPMAAVARRAGVGKATLSRHFATPQELIDAVFLDHMDDYVRVTNEALAVQDPWQGFVQFIVDVCGLQASNRGFADVLTLTLNGDGAMEQRRMAGYTGFVSLIDRAKASGHLRSDFTSEDLVLLLMANAGLIAATALDAPGSWRRLIGQMLRAYASPGAPLPALAAAPTSDLLLRAMARGGDLAGEPQLRDQ